MFYILLMISQITNITCKIGSFFQSRICMLAILEAKRAGLLTRKNFLHNILAGVIVGVVALPLAMAFAIASGVRPEQGLYTAIIAGLIVSICGGSRVQIAGPTGAFIVILAAITAKYGIDGLQIATLMAGVILLLMGAARLGTAIKYIPSPVIVGFTSGIAIIIWVGQWQDFFGLQVATISNSYFHEKVWFLLKSIPKLDMVTTGLAILSLVITIGSPKILKKVPGPLVAIVVATLLQAVFKFDHVATIGSVFGGIPRELPPFHLPDVSWTRVVELIAPAFTIAMLGAIESLLSAVVADGMAGTRHRSNQELMGQGLANIVVPFFGGFAATGAIARTATSIRNGGNSPIAGITHAVTLILVIVLFAPYAAYIPICALSAVLFVVAYNMSEVNRFIDMVKSAPRNDIIILLTTFFLTIFFNLVIAVNVGVILAALFFMRKMAQSVQIRFFHAKKIIEELPEVGRYKLPENVMVYSIDGPLFFGAAEEFEYTMKDIHADAKTVIIRLGRVPFVDVTALQTFRNLLVHFKQRNVAVIVCEANEQVVHKLYRAKIIDLLGKENLVGDLSQAISKAS